MKDSLKNKRAILYMARNKVTDDFYIGVTSKLLEQRKSAHLYSARKRKEKSILHHAIRKYGENSFIWTKIGEMPSYAEGLDIEKYLIREMKPKYNITSGGEGVLGLKHSIESKNKMSIAHKGHKYNLGKKHSEVTKGKISSSKKGHSYNIGRKFSDESKDKMSKNADKNRFKKYSHLGPKSISRKVLCVTDGKIFESASSAASYYGSSKSAVIELCLGKNFRKTVNKRVFKYLEEKNAVAL